MNTYQITWYPPNAATNTPSTATVQAVVFDVTELDVMVFYAADAMVDANVVFMIPMSLHPVVERTG